MSTEPVASSPLWLEYSGLPALLLQTTKSVAGWLLYKKIVELDCGKNSFPGMVEVSLEEISERTGIVPGTSRKLLEILRKKKLITLFLPDNDEEEVLIRLICPQPTPISAETLCEERPDLFPGPVEKMRYARETMALTEEGSCNDDSSSAVLQEIVDMYFDTVGMKMNVFILDELRIIAEKFPIDSVRAMFRRARQNEIHSLHWIVSELIKQRKKTD